MYKSVSNHIREYSKVVLAYSFSSVQADFPSDIAQEILNWSKANIPEEDLAPDGREEGIHVTVKYGLHTHAWDEVRSVLMHQPPFDITLGAISIFENGEHDVVKFTVTSPELLRLNKLISDSFEHTDTHPDYIPHCTLAYVKPGLGAKYVGRKDFDSRAVRIGDLTFSGNDNRLTVLPLLENRSKAAMLRKIAGLLEHAQQEMEKAGLFDKDSDYEGMLGDAVMDLVKCFADQGHSGFSAQMALNIFNTLANWKALTPLTDSPSEWNDVSKESGYPMWQNKRDCACFSKDKGKTYYSVNDKKKKIKKTEKAASIKG